MLFNWGNKLPVGFTRGDAIRWLGESWTFAVGFFGGIVFAYYLCWENTNIESDFKMHFFILINDFDGSRFLAEKYSSAWRKKTYGRVSPSIAR